MLFVIGGQGGNQLGAQIAEGCARRRIPCCVVGVPKSIDNDVMLVDRTFGFETVVQEVVQRPLHAAKVEAASARKGVGLVKARASV
jgi:6-phosphofructokinase 1